MHVYHYAAYEKAALRRLMSRYATREDEIDRILRAGVLVDLYQVVRQGLRASVDSYSIKRIEQFYLSEREGPITRAGFSVVEYERWLGDRDPQHLRDLADYNRDDCLVDARPARLARGPPDRGGGPVRRRPSTDRRSASGLPTEAQVGGLRGDAAPDRRPDRRADRSTRRGGRTRRPARWLLAALLDWHRRDARQAWWDYFRLRELPLDDLIGETEPLGGLEYDGVVGQEKQSLIHRLRFPPQDHKVLARRRRLGGRGGSRGHDPWRSTTSTGSS